jgi:hypothetical protein
VSTWRTSKEGTNGSANTFTVIEPTGIASGDFEFVLVSSNTGSAITTPSGWTLFGSANGANGKFYIFYVTGGRGGSAPTLVFNGTFTSGSIEWHCLAFTNGSVAIDASATTTLGSRTTPDCPSATAIGTTDESLAIAFQFTGGTWTAPSGYTLRSINTGGLDCMCSSKTLVAAGAENPAAYNAVASSDTWEATILVGASGAVSIYFQEKPRRIMN